MDPAGTFIGLSAAALVKGRSALPGTLVVASSLLPIVISTRLQACEPRTGHLRAASRTARRH